MPPLRVAALGARPEARALPGPAVTRTRRQTALLESPAAWAWWTDGYEHGVRAGYAAGYAAGYEAAITCLDDAARLMVETMPPTRGAEIAAARAERAAMLAERPSEDLAERHRRVAASWGLAEGAA